MTLSAPIGFFTLHKKVATPITTMNAQALMVFLLLFFASTLVHADHLIEQGTNVEQIECYLCHQGLDTPPELPQIQLFAVTSHFISLQTVTSVEVKSSDYVQPQLRAPPLLP